MVSASVDVVSVRDGVPIVGSVRDQSTTHDYAGMAGTCSYLPCVVRLQSVEDERTARDCAPHPDGMMRMSDPNLGISCRSSQFRSLEGLFC